jgi:hypothetical protein
VYTTPYPTGSNSDPSPQWDQVGQFNFDLQQLQFQQQMQQQINSSPSSKAAMQAIANNMAQFPTICDPVGIFGFAGNGVSGIVEYDSEGGLSSGALGEIGGGGVGGGGAGTATSSGLQGEGLVFIGGDVGMFTTISKVPQIGPYVEVGIPNTKLSAGVGVYGTLTSEGGCHQ